MRASCCWEKSFFFFLRCLLRVLILICIHVFDSCGVVSAWRHEIEMLISIFVLTMQQYRDSLFRPYWCYFRNSDYWFEAILLRCSCMNDLPWYWTLRHSIVTCVVVSCMWHRFGSCNVTYVFFRINKLNKVFRLIYRVFCFSFEMWLWLIRVREVVTVNVC